MNGKRDFTASGERSVVAETISGTVVTGDHARVVVVQPARFPLPDQFEVPGRVVSLPRPPTSVFVGRDAVLARLERALSERTDVVITQTLHGLGGVGKSELALKYAHWRRTAYSVVWWITAESPQQIDTGLAALAYRLVPEAASTATTEDSAAWALAWLRCHPGWLLVLDNVNEPAHIEALLAGAEGGHVLVTSRRDVRWPGRTTALKLDVLDREAAVTLITHVTGRTGATDRDAADEIAAELGYLPLALDQAAAYIRQTRIPPDRYLQLLRQQPARLYDAAAQGDKAQVTIARLWDLTMEVIAANAPGAVRLLRILAYYAPDDVPRAILGGEHEQMGADIDEALGVLASHSMVTLTDDAVSLHRLTQAVVLNSASSEDRAGVLEPDPRDVALTWLRDALPGGNPGADVSGWPVWHRLIRHIEKIASHYPPEREPADLGAVLRPTAEFMLAQGASQQAHTMLVRAVAISELLLGAEHPATLNCRHDLAAASRTLGRLAEAEAEHRAVLEVRARVLGPEHPDTLTSRNDLAGVLGYLGRWKEEEAEHRAVLDVHARVLGPEHLSTVTVRNNLAFVLLALGRLDEAEAQHRAALDARTRRLGHDHPATLACRNNVGLALRALGRLEEAEALHRATLEARVRVLGPEHPAALTSRNNLGVVWADLGRFEEAEAAHREVLEWRSRERGTDHPGALISHNNLAAVVGYLGRWEEAEDRHGTVLETRVRVLGPEHPAALTSRNNLAFVLLMLGRLAEAEIQHRATLGSRAGVLGPEHPATLTTRNNLACLLRVLGRNEEAEAEHRAVLEALTRVLGAEHPNTLTSCDNLTYLLQNEEAPLAVPVPDPIAFTGRFNLVNLQADLMRAERDAYPASPR
jgi:tetratricopeptide (TPR) repeat protein